MRRTLLTVAVLLTVGLVLADSASARRCRRSCCDWGCGSSCGCGQSGCCQTSCCQTSCCQSACGGCSSGCGGRRHGGGCGSSCGSSCCQQSSGCGSCGCQQGTVHHDHGAMPGSPTIGAQGSPACSAADAVEVGEPIDARRVGESVWLDSHMPPGILIQPTCPTAGKTGTGTICAKHPPGRSGKWCLSPFSRITGGRFHVKRFILPRQPVSRETRIFLEEKKGTGIICAKHPPGHSGKWCLSPFPVCHSTGLMTRPLNSLG